MPRKIRTIRIDGNIAYVPLTKGYEAIIDAEDVPIIGKWNWTAHVSPHTTYAKRAENNGQKHQTIYMHRFLVGGVGDLQVDHKDCIGLKPKSSLPPYVCFKAGAIPNAPALPIAFF